MNSPCNVGLHHKCDDVACGCTCNHIGVPAPVPATDHVALQDASSPALKRANEKAGEAVAEYWKKVGFRL